MYLINHEYHDFCAPSDIDNSNPSCIVIKTGEKSRTDQIGEKRVHLYYSYKFKQLKYVYECINRPDRDDCNQFFYYIDYNIRDLNRNVKNTYYNPDERFITHEQPIKDISQYAETYLKHFQLEFIDFCISNKQQKLINYYNTIYNYIISNNFKEAFRKIKELKNDYIEQGKYFS
jgi:hypothetical protein